MKHIKSFYFIAFLSGFLISANGQDAVRDYDGNLYKTVKAGTSIWMADNLKVTHYRNGDPIPDVRESSLWKDLTSGASCNISNIPAYAKTFGLLYNWYAAADKRNVCPAGWHVPSDPEWNELAFFLSGEKVSGGILPANSAINQSLFGYLPEGLRGFDGEFTGLGYGGGGWWSATPDAAGMALYRSVSYNTVSRRSLAWSKNFGYHIRCIKD